uniref:HrPost-1 protein n=1 Tax=Halocynthia roretzi TaxID=7729 RepID=Q95PT7_HALRO|nr:HrPost-1 [Halocynthia roretzi]
MKIAVIIALSFCGIVFAQDTNDNIRSVITWPQHEYSLGGAYVLMDYENLGSGSCIVSLPKMVNLFHATNGHIVPSLQSNPLEGQYKIAAPASWELINGSFAVLIVFSKNNIFSISEITMMCDQTDVANISVYSFPQNNLIQQASSNIFYRPGFHMGDVLTITLPNSVARFNFTTGGLVVASSDDMTVHTASGFTNEPGINDMKEVAFELVFNNEDETNSEWFSAAEITVSIQNIQNNI